MPWTEEDFVRGTHDAEAAITSARPRAEGLLRRTSTDARDALLVLPRDDHWVVRYARSKRVIAAFAGRDQAVFRARRLAAEIDAELVIHEER